jgi:hypothetical protein
VQGSAIPPLPANLKCTRGGKIAREFRPVIYAENAINGALRSFNLPLPRCIIFPGRCFYIHPLSLSLSLVSYYYFLWRLFLRPCARLVDSNLRARAAPWAFGYRRGSLRRGKKALANEGREFLELNSQPIGFAKNFPPRVAIIKLIIRRL